MYMARKFSELNSEDTVYILEQDRRAGYLIFDTAKIHKNLGSSPRPTENGNKYQQVSELILIDSISELTIKVPSDLTEGVYNSVYYTTDLENIIREVNLQKQKALNIINSLPKAQAMVEECDNILSRVQQDSGTKPSHSSQSNLEIEEFKSEVRNNLAQQQKMLQDIYGALGLSNKSDGQEPK